MCRTINLFCLYVLAFACVTQTATPADALRRLTQAQKMSGENEKTYKILISHPEVPKGVLQMMSRACELIICESLPPKRAEVLEKVKGVHAIFWASHDKLDVEVLDTAGSQLKAISTMSAGIDNVDVEELKRRGIPLGHTPDVLNDAVADIAVGLMLAAARRFHEGREKIATSTWENYHIEWMWGREIRDSTVGFFGFGGIGQAIAKRMSGFSVGKILYNTRSRVASDIEKEFAATHVTFDTLLRDSDFIFLAAPLTNATAGIFNAAAFEKMKNTAVLVNIGRGGIVNQNDLYTALKTNQIFSAGLDVMTPEPLASDDQLMSLPNCVLIPHIGSATQRTRTDMATIAAHNVLRGLAGEPMFAPAY